jgi:peptidoglycan hydrolase CwlO-like protein
VVRRDIPEAAEEANRIEAILNEIKEVIGRKIEALEKIGDIKSQADQLKGKVNKIEEDLTSEATSLLGENFRSSLKEIFSLAESFKA